MHTRIPGSAAQILLLVICLLPAQAVACALHQGNSLQNSFGEFHLPSAGDNVANVSRIYGEPLRKMSGGKGMEIWDYGSFRVILKDSRVTFAGLW